MKLIHRKTVKKVPKVDWRRTCLDLDTYRNEIKNIFDGAWQRGEHCEEYEELTMEEKLLVDADVDFLINEEFIHGGEGLLFFNGMDKFTLEKCLARLRKRDRKYDKRNRK